MAQFTNQAQLSFGNYITNSNIAVGEIIEVLSATKTALRDILPNISAIYYRTLILRDANREVHGTAFGHREAIPNKKLT